MAFALADAAGEVRARQRRPTEPSGDPTRDLLRIAADAESLLTSSGVTRSEVDAVGVSAPGPQDRRRGRVTRPPNLPGWEDVPVRDALAEALQLPVHLENDANAAALAEWRFGAGQGCRDLVYLTMSTGVGGGLVLGGRLHTGASGNAGEVGHVPVKWRGRRCACGGRGCLEAYVGGAAWTRRLRERAPEDGRLVALAGGRNALTPEHVIAAAREGDAFARAEMERFVHYLARGICSLVLVLAPELVVLGTIAAAAGEDLCFAPLREEVRRRLWPELTRDLRIVPSALGERLPDLAGVCVALHATGELEQKTSAS